MQQGPEHRIYEQLPKEGSGNPYLTVETRDERFLATRGQTEEKGKE